jgi:hypothetical protein
MSQVKEKIFKTYFEIYNLQVTNAVVPQSYLVNCKFKLVSYESITSKLQVTQSHNKSYKSIIFK